MPKCCNTTCYAVQIHSHRHTSRKSPRPFCSTPLLANHMCVFAYSANSLLNALQLEALKQGWNSCNKDLFNMPQSTCVYVHVIMCVCLYQQVSLCLYKAFTYNRTWTAIKSRQNYDESEVAMNDEKHSYANYVALTHESIMNLTHPHPCWLGTRISLEKYTNQNTRLSVGTNHHQSAYMLMLKLIIDCDFLFTS